MIMNDLTLLINLIGKQNGKPLCCIHGLGKRSFVNLRLNVKEGCCYIKVLFTSLILLEMRQCEHGP